MTLIARIKKLYLAEIWVLDGIKSVFLLIVRLYFGLGFISAGWGKLTNVQAAAEFFESVHIPMPTLNVYMAGTTETVCGALLVLGFASRIITIPLIGTMIVAYLTAHTEQLYAIWDNTPLFFKAAPFPYLYTCLVVLFFGPGLLSADGVIKMTLANQKPQPAAPAPGTEYQQHLLPSPADADDRFAGGDPSSVRLK